MTDLALMVHTILTARYPNTKGAPVATKTATRIYQVTQGEFVRLVRATHPGVALRHVAEGILSVRVADTEDVVKAMKAGIDVEDIKQEQGCDS